jgi:hypothetical protein
MTRRTVWTALSVLPLLAALSGCDRAGAGGAAAAEDERAIAELVSGVEGLRDARTAAKYFAKGSVPAAARLKELGKYSLQPSGRPAVDGDTATARVRLSENRTGRDAGEVEWAFVKEGGAWKIKTVALP